MIALIRSDQDEYVQKVINELDSQRFRLIRISALYNGVLKATVADRTGGRMAKAKKSSNRSVLQIRRRDLLYDGVVTCRNCILVRITLKYVQCSKFCFKTRAICSLWGITS